MIWIPIGLNTGMETAAADPPAVAAAAVPDAETQDESESSGNDHDLVRVGLIDECEYHYELKM